MVRHICTNCNYKFDHESNECPYCGKDSIETEKNAGELIDDVNRILRE